MSKLAVILIRGTIGLNPDIKDTLQMLNLKSKNNCIILEDTPIVKGMLHKVKDYTTFGEITEETEKELKQKRGKEGQKTYKLNPPRGGYARKGTKKNYKDGGALGPRDNMNELIKKMI